jgi:hypothetical protein
MGTVSRVSGRELLGKIRDRLGIDGLTGVEISAKLGGVVVMKLERLVSSDEIDAYFPAMNNGTIESTTVVEVGENVRVTFQV